MRRLKGGMCGRGVTVGVVLLAFGRGTGLQRAAHAAGTSTAPPASAVYVGQITGTDATLGLVVVSDRATAFVAGGTQTRTSLSGFFEGGVSRGKLRLEDGAGRALTGQITSASAGGSLVLADGRTLAWSTNLADARKGAGVFLFADTRAITAATVSNGGRLQGISRSFRNGRLAAASLSGSLQTGDRQRVSIPGSRTGTFVTRELVRVRTPIRGLLELWAFQPQGANAARQSIIAATDSFGNLINPWDVAVVPSGSEDAADIVLLTDRITHNVFAFDTCSDPPTIQVSASGVFDNIRDIDLGFDGLWVSNTTELFNFALPDPIPTFQIPGFGICDDISFRPDTGNFVVLDVLDTALNGTKFDALLEVAPDGLSADEIKNPLHGSDQNLGTGGRLHTSAIAYGDDYLVAWTGRFGSGIDRVTASGSQSRFAWTGTIDGFTGKGTPTDMVLFGEDVIVAVVSPGLPGGSALLRINPEGEISIVTTAVGEHRPNGLAVERHLNDAHIIVADYHIPPPDAAHGGTDDPVGGNIVRVFLDDESELAHNVRVVQCQAGF